MDYFQDVFMRVGGAEQVLLSSLSADARQIIVGAASAHGATRLRSHRPHTRFLQIIEGLESHPERFYEPLARTAPTLPIFEGDLLSFHHHFGLQARGSGRTSYYLHTPTRLIHEPERVPWEVAVVPEELRAVLAEREHENIAKAAAIMTNSGATSMRVRASYGVESQVVHPPAQLWRLAAAIVPPTPPAFVFTAIRLARSKALLTCAAILAESGIPWVVAGEGTPDVTDALRGKAILLGRCDRRAIATLARNAAVCLSPAVEDFGIFAAECLTIGRPVVVRQSSGVLDLRGLGALFEFQDPDADGGASLLAAIDDAYHSQPASTRSIGALRIMLSPAVFRRNLARVVGTS